MLTIKLKTKLKTKSKSKSKSKSKIIGSKQESVALKFLTKRNLKLICRNFNCKVGEIDIIMQDQEYLVFIEVRYRKLNSYVSACESVNYHKQQKIIRASTYYLLQHNLYDKTPIRFDIIAIDNHPIHPINWIKNAF